MNTYGSVKNVKAKIDTTRETTIHVSPECVNLIRELPMYSWKRNKDGELLEEPVKRDDHSIDALCYLCFGVFGELSKDKPYSTFADEIYVY